MDPEPFKPPTFHSLPYCIFCQKGCKCIGICCRETKKAPIKSQFGKAAPQSVTFPPGLKGTSTQTSLVALKEVNEPETYKRRIAAFSSNSDIFKWGRVQSKTTSSTATYDKSSTPAVVKLHSPAVKSMLSNNSPPSPTYDEDRLRYFLKRCGTRINTATKSA